MKTSTYGSIQFTMEELGLSLEEIRSLPWVRAGVAKVIPNRFGVEFKIGAFVGTLGVGENFSIEVEEMVPGTVRACLSLSTSDPRRGQQSMLGRRNLSAHEEVAVQFGLQCAKVLARGPVKAYLPATYATPRPRGKIDIPTTLMKLRARGRLDLIQCKVRDLSDDTPVNRVLLAAALAAERILKDRPEQRLEIRRCIAALSGVTRHAHPPIPRAWEVSGDGVAQAMTLAETLLSGIPISPTEEGSRSAFSVWVNVDRIFEEAVRSIFLKCGLEARVVKGQECGVHLFHAAPGEPAPLPKRAEPDIVVFRDDGKVLVVDVKYRLSGERPTEEQLYQLAAHAGAFRADAAALFVPFLGRASEEMRRYGRLADGCSVDVVPVKADDAREIERSVTAWLESIPSRPGGSPERRANPGPVWESSFVSPAT